MARCDVVVIGAGLGGLTAGAILARAGRKVLVIERSNSVGGAASSYKSGDLFIEGSLQETSDPRHPLDPKHDALTRAGVLDAVKWIPRARCMRRAADRCEAPFVMPDNFDAARHALTERFPQARAGHRSVARAKWRASRCARAGSLAQDGSAPDRIRRTGRCRCRRSSMPCSATTKRSNALSPPTCRIFTTTPRRCGGSISRWRRAAICKAAGVSCRADRSGCRARWPAPSAPPAARCSCAASPPASCSMRKAAPLPSRTPPRMAATARPWNARRVVGNAAPGALAGLMPDAAADRLQAKLRETRAVDFTVRHDARPGASRRANSGYRPIPRNCCRASCSGCPTSRRARS